MKSSDRLHLNQPDFIGWIFDTLHLGLIIVDGDARILAVNKWFEQRADVDSSCICNRPLVEVFPELRGSRLERAVTDAIRTGYASVLSQSLNRAPFPLYPPSVSRSDDTPQRLQQVIQVIPRADEGKGGMAVIQIEDVSASVRRENLLRQQSGQLQQMAYIDSLTGVANRRRFEEFLNTEVLRARRSRHPVSLIMFDIDHFKRYNDTRGHQEGDRCIFEVAQAAQMALKRPADLLARYGGDEFAIVLPETDHVGAMIVAEEIRTHVVERQIRASRTLQDAPITISLGVGSGYPDRGVTVSGLIALADEALYHSKLSGRNTSTERLAKD
jgi:diguanylate cyclase (GGDEF)-like protein